MNKKQVEKKINSGFTNATPDVFDSVQEDCRGVHYNMAQTAARPAQRKFTWTPWKIATFALAFILVAVVIAGSIGLNGEYASAATVSLDVNPSVEIKINSKQRVISAVGLNDEGKDIIGEMDLKGCQLEVAVNAVIGAMLRKGYLSELANSVLVSVDSNKSLYDEIVNKVTDGISLTMQDKNITASVVAQWIKSSDAVSALAKKYDISQGKAQLIHKIAQASALYTEEQLVALSVNDLSLILSNLNIEGDDLTHSGTASDKTYIGADEALKIALAKLGMEGLTADSEGLTVEKSKLDYEDGLMVYEIEFTYGAFEYEVLVGAFSGKILSFECEAKDYNPDTDQEKLDEDAIILKVLQHANVAEEDLADVMDEAWCERSGYYHIEVYTVFFEYNDYFYEYEIDCYGNVLYYAFSNYYWGRDEIWGDGHWDEDDKHHFGGQITPPQNQKLTEQEVKEIVLWLMDVRRESEISDWKCELKANKNGMDVYEVEFVLDGMEYELKINAATGAVMRLDYKPCAHHRYAY